MNLMDLLGFGKSEIDKLDMMNLLYLREAEIDEDKATKDLKSISKEIDSITSAIKAKGRKMDQNLENLKRLNKGMPVTPMSHSKACRLLASYMKK